MSTGLAVAADNPAATAATRQHVMQSYANLPMSFTANAGQEDPHVAFVAQGSGYAIRLDRKGAELTFGEVPRAEEGGKSVSKSTFLKLSFPGANESPAISGLDRLPGDSNYLIGADPSRWHTSVPNYARVKYAGLYPGVDLVYYGNHRQLEFDFVVAPHADVSTVRMELKNLTEGNGKQLSVNKQGDLVLGGETGTVLLHKPILYQAALVDGRERREAVEGAFVVDGGQSVRFHVGSYDHARELVIDPTLVYSTYFGGNGLRGYPMIRGLAIDGSGEAFVLGFTGSTDFPITPGALQTTNTEFFLSKINRAGSALLYSTYLGTPNGGDLTALALNSKGEAYVGGFGTTFPATAGAFQRTHVGLFAAFVTKVNATGTGLIYATYLNGTKDRNGYSEVSQLAVDAQDNAYVLGGTSSDDFPTTPGVLQPLPPGSNSLPFQGSGFLAKLNPAGSGLVYSTYLADDVGGFAFALDPSNNVYILGTNPVTDTQAPISPGAFSNTGELHLDKVNASASALIYYTHLGEYFPDNLAVDKAGAAYMVGTEDSLEGAPSYPGLNETTCPTLCQNVFVLKMNTTGTALDYRAFLGRSTGDEYVLFTQSTGTSIAVDAAGNAYVAGSTNDPLFPITPDAAQKVLGYSSYYGGNAFLTKLDPSGTKVTYSTFLGAVGDSSANFVAVDGMGDAVIAGSVVGDFVTTPNPIQATDNQSGGQFVSELNLGEPFCSFTASLQLETVPDKTQGFALEAGFTLGSSTPLQPETEPLTLTIGAATMTIPSGSLVKSPLGYTYSGMVDGVRLLLFLGTVAPQPGAQATCGTPAYKLTAVGVGAEFGGVSSPVNVAVSIGDDSGSAEVKAIGLR